MIKEETPNVYELSRAWFDFAFANPEKIKTNHPALFFFAIEHCNRLGWKPKFGLPTSMAMEAIGIKSYNTYIATLTDLVEWGFIKMVEKSKNQYSSNIIALSKNTNATTKALDKALTKHLTKQGVKQSESTSESIDSIDKQLYKDTIDTNLQEYNECAEDSIGEDSLDTSELTKKILSDFGFNEITNHDKLRLVASAIREIILEGRLDYFSQQYRDYMTYKTLAKEMKHNLPAFFGDPPGWDSANWSKKIQDHAPPGKEGKILSNIKKANAVVNPFE